MNQEHPDFSPQISPNASHKFFTVAQSLQNLIDSVPSKFATRRKHQRVPRSISVSLQPLDDDFKVVGDQLWVVSRDISPNGIGILSYDPIRHEHVKVGLLNESVSALGTIRHNTFIGHKYPLYLVGIEFLSETES